MGFRVETVLTGTSGAPYFNRLNFLETQGVDPALDATNAAAAAAAFWIALSPALHESLDWAVQQDVIQYAEGTGQPVASYPQGGQFGKGSAISDPLPWATQMLVQWFTGIYVGGRQIRGRTFVPGLNESQSSNGRPDPDTMDLVQAAGQALVDDADSTLGIYSKGQTRAVTGVGVWSKWAILTSRRD